MALVGIAAVDILIERLPKGADKLGLTKESIRTDVELKLRLAGIRVIEVHTFMSVSLCRMMAVRLALKSC